MWCGAREGTRIEEAGGHSRLAQWPLGYEGGHFSTRAQGSCATGGPMATRVLGRTADRDAYWRAAFTSTAREGDRGFAEGGNRRERPTPEHPHQVRKTVLLYGILGGVLIAALKLVEYRFLVIEHSLEIYGGLSLGLFRGLVRR